MQFWMHSSPFHSWFWINLGPFSYSSQEWCLQSVYYLWFARRRWVSVVISSVDSSMGFFSASIKAFVLPLQIILISSRITESSSFQLSSPSLPKYWMQWHGLDSWYHWSLSFLWRFPFSTSNGRSTLDFCTSFSSAGSSWCIPWIISPNRGIIFSNLHNGTWLLIFWRKSMMDPIVSLIPSSTVSMVPSGVFSCATWPVGNPSVFSVLWMKFYSCLLALLFSFCWYPHLKSLNKLLALPNLMVLSSYLSF